jgi:hypothetical protein
MLMKSRGGPLLWLMNSRGGPPHFERGSATRDNFYGSYGTVGSHKKLELDFIKSSTFAYIPCGPSMLEYPGTSREPAVIRRGEFPYFLLTPWSTT